MSYFSEVISRPHQEVHEGEFYQAGHFDTAVANNASLEFLIKVGANKSLHSIIGTSVGGNCYAYIYEGTTTSADGTSVTAVNSKRSSANTSDATFFHTPTVTADGTLIGQGFVPGGSGNKAVGGSANSSTRDGSEIILKKSTNYLVRITNKAGAAVEVSLTHAFYESTGD